MPTRGDAFLFLEREWAPAHGPAGSLLYVGHRSDTSPWWSREFAAALGGPELAVLDIVPAQLQSAGGVTEHLFHGDVRSPGSDPRRFDLVFWDEGPEHVPMEDALTCIEMLRSRHGSVLISCPWGMQSQGSGPDDPEFHHWGPLPDDFVGIGMQARAFGRQFPDGHGNVIAWT